MLWAGGEEMAPSSLHLTDGVPSIAAVQPVNVSTWIEASTRELDAPSVKPRLAALRHHPGMPGEIISERRARAPRRMTDQRIAPWTRGNPPFFTLNPREPGPSVPLRLGRLAHVAASDNKSTLESRMVRC
jgi:hypothetical protein